MTTHTTDHTRHTKTLRDHMGAVKERWDQQGVFAKSNLFETMGLCEAH